MMMFHPTILGSLPGLRFIGTAGSMVVLPVLAAAMAVWFLLSVAQSRQTASGVSRVEEAVEIVRQRFAHGEIDAAEYNRIVTGLTRPS